MSEGIPTTRTGMRLEEERAPRMRLFLSFFSSFLKDARRDELHLQFSRTVGSELSHRTRTMEFHGSHGELEPFGDLPIGEALPGQKRHLSLALRERREGLPCLAGNARRIWCGFGVRERLSMAARSLSARTGFVRKVTAPLSIASTAISMSPCAERKMTGRSISRSAKTRCSTSPLIFPMRTSRTAQPGSLKKSPARKSSALKKCRTL